MTYLIFVLTILTICFFILSYKNRYAIFLASMVIAIAGILFSSLNLIFKTGYYNYTSHLWGSIDYDFFRFLTKINVGYNRIIQINNVSVSVYMFSVIAFTFLYFRENRTEKINTAVYRLLFHLIFPIFYVWFYDPNTVYNFFIHIRESNSVKNIIYTVDLLNYIIVLTYAVLPLALVYRSIRKNGTYINKKRAISVSTCLVIIDVFFMLVLCVGLFRKPYLIDENLISVKKLDNRLASEAYILITFFGVILVLLTLFVINKYSMTSKLGFVKQRVFKHNLNSLNQNYINVFHSVKNIIFSYKLLLEKARSKEGEEKEHILDELESKIDDYVSRISFMLDVENNNLETELESSTISQLVEESLHQLNPDKSIEIIKRLSSCNSLVNIDFFYMTDALINIIQNAIDAIKKSETTHGRIIFETSNDGEWTILKVSDNGVGMSKKEISNLFKPFYTTKSRITNWGIGLSFSYRIIRFHGGYISVESTVNQGTDFYIYLPTIGKNSSL